MVKIICIALLIGFMWLSSIAALFDLASKPTKRLEIILTDSMTLISGLSSFAYFFVSKSTFLPIAAIACAVIIVCAILNGLLNGNFHLFHHILRALFVIVTITISFV